jgi:hypothetical protein
MPDIYSFLTCGVVSAAFIPHKIANDAVKKKATVTKKLALLALVHSLSIAVYKKIERTANIAPSNPHLKTLFIIYFLWLINLWTSDVSSQELVGF